MPGAKPTSVFVVRSVGVRGDAVQLRSWSVSECEEDTRDSEGEGRDLPSISLMRRRRLCFVEVVDGGERAVCTRLLLAIASCSIFDRCLRGEAN